MEENRRNELISRITHHHEGYHEMAREFTDALTVDELTEWIGQGYRDQVDYTKYPIPHKYSRGEEDWDEVFSNLVETIRGKPDCEKTYIKFCGAVANVFESIETDYSKIIQANYEKNFVGLAVTVGTTFACLKKENENVQNSVMLSPEIKKLEEVVGKFVRANQSSEESRNYELMHAKSLFLYADLQKNNFDSEFWESVFEQDNGRYAGMAFYAMCNVDLSNALMHMPGLVAAEMKYPKMVDLTWEFFFLYYEKTEEVIQKTNNCIVESFKGKESTEEAKAFTKEYHKVMSNFKMEIDERLLFNGLD